jgi:hypothetical protein
VAFQLVPVPGAGGFATFGDHNHGLRQLATLSLADVDAKPAPSLSWPIRRTGYAS